MTLTELILFKILQTKHFNISYANPQQGMTPPKFDANFKMNDACSYCGQFEHYSRDFFKRKYHKSKHRN